MSQSSVAFAAGSNGLDIVFLVVDTLVLVNVVIPAVVVSVSDV